MKSDRPRLYSTLLHGDTAGLRRASGKLGPVPWNTANMNERISLAADLELKKASILRRWSQYIIDTYPADTATFLSGESDRFLNPIGRIIRQETQVIFTELLHEMNLARLTGSLTEIVRIRSVQDFTPARAIGFVFLLKKAVREEIAGGNGHPASGELADFESRIDSLALLAFDIYMKCREQVYEIRMNEVSAQKEMALRALAMAGASGESE